MRFKTAVPDEMWHLARSQAGMLTNAQVIEFGFTRTSIQRLFHDNVLWRLARGLYSLTPDPTWEALIWGGVLLGGPESCIGLAAAGYLHGIHDRPKHIDVLVPRRMVPRGPWRFHPIRATGVGTPARTDLETTALHLCENQDLDGLVGVLTAAVGTRRTTAQRILSRLATTPSVSEQALIAEILGDAANGVHSALEARYVRDVESAHGLPSATRQAETLKSSFSDNFYDTYHAVVELDGQLGHTGTGAWRDYRRDNRNTLKGRATLRFGWNDVLARPCEVASTVASLLRRGGWTGTVRPCPRCSAQSAS